MSYPLIGEDRFAVTSMRFFIPERDEEKRKYWKIDQYTGVFQVQLKAISGGYSSGNKARDQELAKDMKALQGLFISCLEISGA
jgi:hypothetical protein